MFHGFGENTAMQTVACSDNDVFGTAGEHLDVAVRLRQFPSKAGRDCVPLILAEGSFCDLRMSGCVGVIFSQLDELSSPEQPYTRIANMEDGDISVPGLVPRGKTRNRCGHACMTGFQQLGIHHGLIGGLNAAEDVIRASGVLQ